MRFIINKNNKGKINKSSGNKSRIGKIGSVSFCRNSVGHVFPLNTRSTKAFTSCIKTPRIWFYHIRLTPFLIILLIISLSLNLLLILTGNEILNTKNTSSEPRMKATEEIGIFLMITGNLNNSSKQAFVSDNNNTTPFAELFDVEKGDVIKTFEADEFLQKTAETYIYSINGMYIKVNAFPSKGKILKIPLSKPIYNENIWYKGKIDVLYIIFPYNEAPYLLILDEKSRPLFFTFTAGTDELSEYLKKKQLI